MRRHAVTKDKKHAAKDQASWVEALLGEPYWVVDVLPSQVPADAGGRFFAVEPLLTEGPRGADLRRRFADVVLKLYCYHDIVVFRGESSRGKANPKPEKLDAWIVRRDPLCILLPAQDALLQVPEDGTCMTLYHPTPELLEQVRQIAAASGLFVWQPGA